MASVSGSIGLTNQFQFREKYEQLKEAEQKEKLLKPRERVDKIEAQHKDIEELINKLNAIKATASDITESKMLGEKNLKTEGESATISVSKGVSAMDFSLDVKKLAKKDTFQTNAFKNDEVSLLSGKKFKFEENGEHKTSDLESVDFTISIDSHKFNIHLDKFTTLNQLADKLNNAKTDDDDAVALKDLINVKIIDAGKDGYRLMLGSKKAGEKNSINFDISGADDKAKAASEAALKALGFDSVLQENKAAELEEKSQKLLDDTLALTGANEFDTKGFADSLGTSKITLKTADGMEFSVDKDTDIMRLPKAQREAVYEHQRRETIAQWAVQQGDIKIGDITVDASNVNELSKDADKWAQIEDSYYDAKAAEWLVHLSENDRTVEIEKPAAPEQGESAGEASETPSTEGAESAENTEGAESAENTEGAENAESAENAENAENRSAKSQEPAEKLLIGKDNQANWQDLSADDKKLVIAKFKELMKEGFEAKASLLNAQDKLKSAQEQADKNHIQRGSDAVFSYEGMEITRSENTVDDLILGAKIKLVKEGKTEFKIEADAEELIKNIDEFVSAFNSFANNINAATDFDKEANKAKGTLMGINEVQSARSQLMSILGKTIDGMSLNVLGVSVNKEGIVEFDHAEFKKAYEKDADKVERFLLGGTDYEEFSVTSKPISAMPAIASGDLLINDKKISLDSEFLNRLNGLDKNGLPDETVQKPTMKDYQQALLKAIKDAEIEGVKASFNDDGALVLTSDGKQGISISGIDDKLFGLGLSVQDKAATGKSQKGLFDEVQNLIKNLTSKKEGSEGILVKFNQNLNAEKDKITKDMDEVKKDIDKRFDTLKDKLVRYDAILYKIDLQRQAIEGAMKAAFAQKN